MDEHGEIVDSALRRRLTAAIGETVGVDPEIHLRRVLREVKRAQRHGVLS